MGKADYSGVMETYEKLKKLGLKGEADSVMGEIAKKYPKDTSAPPEEIQQGLEGILSKHQQETGISRESGKREYALGLVSILAFIALASAGMPYVPLH